MREENEIQHRFRQLKERKLKRLFKSRLKRRPCNCVFNREHSFEKDGDKVETRLCIAGFDRPDWKVDFCETNKQAEKCPIFLLNHTKDDLQKDFEDHLSDPEWLRANHMDLYYLSWVLNDTDVPFTWTQRLRLMWAAWTAPKDVHEFEESQE